ncbi:MAG: DNA cytosine methyltransferase, partial [Candidatus Saccharimonadales bacterium]
DSATYDEVELKGTIVDISTEFSVQKPAVSPFHTAGVMINRKASTLKVMPVYDGKRVNLSDILIDENEVPKEFFIDETTLDKWKYMKGGKKEERVTKLGHKYFYSEGPMAFPDALDRPSRTIVTGEGGTTASRFKHVVLTPSGRYRRLTPLELERLDMFPDNHTSLGGVRDVTRAFIAGNALVVGVIQRFGEVLAKRA